jgi:hypothetical protein
MVNAQLSFLKGFTAALALIIVAFKDIFSDRFWYFNAGSFGHSISVNTKSSCDTPLIRWDRQLAKVGFGNRIWYENHKGTEDTKFFKSYYGLF